MPHLQNAIAVKMEWNYLLVDIVLQTRVFVSRGAR